MLADVTRTEKGPAFLFCNEAIVRGAIEAGVKVVTFYPGSPVSENLDTFDAIADQLNIKMEIATNEKVALEIVAGASMTGQRSLTAMKSVGLNVASDAFHSLGIRVFTRDASSSWPTIHGATRPSRNKTAGCSPRVPTF